MKKMRILVIAALLVLLMVSFASAAESRKVIGKFHAGEGAIVLLLVPQQGGMQMIPAVSGKDQIFYINEKVEAEGRFAYLGDATGFIVLCREHGPEELPLPVLFIVPGDTIDADGKGLADNPIRVEIF